MWKNGNKYEEKILKIPKYAWELVTVEYYTL